MSKGKLEPGALCILVGEHRNYEQNIGAILRLTQHVVCNCGCGSSGWEFEEASRPLLVSILMTPFGVIPVDFMVASSDADSNPGWRTAPSRPRFKSAFLLPIKGEGLEDADELKSTPGVENTWVDAPGVC